MNRAIPFLAPLAFAAFALLAWHSDWLCDDAYISFRYARHLAAGDGLVFNTAREVPVEGYSNFLWVLWLGAGEWLGLKSTLVARASSALCGALLLLAVVRFLRGRSGLNSLGAGAAAMFLATLPPFAVWSTSGLASMPTALFLFLCFVHLLGDPERPRPWLAALFALATALVRADGAVWVGMLLVGVWLHDALARGSRPRGRALLIVSLVLVIGVGAHVLWRMSTYGDWLPLTARVKAGFSTARLARGLDYIVAWLLIVPAIPIVLLVSALLARNLPRALTVPAATIVISAMLYATWVGGDFMPFGRFLFPSLPFVALLFGAIVERLARARAMLAASMLLLCVGTSLAANFDRNLIPEETRQHFDFRIDRAWQSEIERKGEMELNARRWVLLGRALARHTVAGDSLILGGIGAVSYHSELFIYDNYGLVTPEVVASGQVIEGSSPGHDLRVNPPFFLEYEPTFLGAYLTPAGGIAPNEPLPWWTDVRPPDDWEAHRWGALMDVETYPLDPDDGFPENAELVLLRIR
ncbi:MAG: arabinofuranosyltransferase [Chlamydiales bacterium]